MKLMKIVQVFCLLSLLLVIPSRADAFEPSTYAVGASIAGCALGLGFLHKAYKQYIAKKEFALKMQQQFDQAHPQVEKSFAQIHTLIMDRKPIPEDVCTTAIDAFTRLTDTLAFVRFTPNDLKRELTDYNKWYKDQQCSYAKNLTDITTEIAHGVLKTLRLKELDSSSGKSYMWDCFCMFASRLF